MYISSKTAEKLFLRFMTGFNLYMHISPTLLKKNKHSLCHVVYLFILQMTFFTCVLISVLSLFALKTNTEKNVTKTHHHQQQQLY